uniref:uncharacterized protein LOC109965893 isoform X2 n=1 Tax=Monopterus albus TaxID=43700 RepID=UPI0009B3D8A1|nr:Purkinje cell protein 2 homolog isoform X2 [Monopterus albus]
MDLKSEATDTVLEQERILNIRSYSQHGMDKEHCTSSPFKTTQIKTTHAGSNCEESFHALDNNQGQYTDDLQVSLPGFNYQEPRSNRHHGSDEAVPESTSDRNRKLLLGPSNQLQVPSQHDHSHSIMAESPDDQQKFMNVIFHGQRGRIEDQRCSLDPNNEMFFSLLADTQSDRLDDQRVFLPSLPGLENVNATSVAGGDSSHLCYMVSKVQDTRLEDQRCALPQIPTLETQCSTQKDKAASGLVPPSSASFSPIPYTEESKTEDTAYQKEVLTADEDVDFSTHCQHEQLDQQRCVLHVSPQSTPKHRPSQTTTPKGIQNGGTTSASTAAEMDASYLCYMVSKVQGSRIDEQRCSAPHIFQSLGTPSAQCKDRSNKLPWRSASLNRVKTDRHWQVAPAEQELFLKMISHAQRGRMEEQRCFLQPSRSTPATPTHNGSTVLPGAEADAFFKMIASSQARRLDDQRVSLPNLPGISGDSEAKEHDRNINAEIPASSPHISVAEDAPTTPQDCSRPTSQPQMAYAESASPRVLPKSASFTPETEHQKKLHSLVQVTVNVSMSFIPQQAQETVVQPCTFPELSLTLGAPGDSFVVPLSPVPGRPLSVNLYLVPGEDIKSRQCSPSRGNPRKAPSRMSSPKTGTTSKTHFVTLCPQEEGRLVTGPNSPDKDCFSLMDKNHTAQVQNDMAQGGQNKERALWKGEGKGRARKREEKEKKKKDRKNGGNKQ